MILGIDHILIAVDDVEQAAATYRRLGFQVIAGGAHPKMGTHNALVPLADGVYLELIGVQDRSLARRFPHTRHVLEALARPNRLALFALDTDDVGAEAVAARARGLEITDAEEGERVRPDGQRVVWRTAHPGDARLPFLLQDVTPRNLRIPPPQEGIGRRLRVSELRYRAADPAEMGAALGKLTGKAPAGRLQALPRGVIRIEPGERDELAALELEREDTDRLAEQWQQNGVEFQVVSKGALGQKLIPAETAGAPLAILGR